MNTKHSRHERSYHVGEKRASKVVGQKRTSVALVADEAEKLAFKMNCQGPRISHQGIWS